MWYGILLYLGGTVLALIAVIGTVAFLFYICGWVSVDGLISATDGRATLTCWHCGEQTHSGLRHCEHCGQELQ